MSIRQRRPDTPVGQGGATVDHAAGGARVLVVALYNAHVALLRSTLPAGARVPADLGPRQRGRRPERGNALIAVTRFLRGAG